MNEPLSIYLAGELFDHKHLTGNALLASYIEKGSEGRYTCVLPQNMEQVLERAVDIRNQDLYYVMNCDLGLFNFDGTELDSGTVVEYMFAKFLDIPAVIIRSDFRSGGDQRTDDWNLMCSSYPRTHILRLHAMALYQQLRQPGEDVSISTDRYYKHLATEVVQGFNKVVLETPISKGNRKDIERIYQWAMDFPGSGFNSYSEREGFLDELISSKIEKGLL